MSDYIKDNMTEYNIETDINIFNILCYNHVRYCVIDLPTLISDNSILVEFEIILNKINNESNYQNQIKYKKLILGSILYVRSISCGLGYGQLAYKMMEIYLYHSYHKFQTIFQFNDIILLLLRFVEYKSQDYYVHGSWKDVTLFIDTLHHSDMIHEEYTKIFINRIIEQILIPQMIKDNINMNNNHKISLCGKWLPRESSKAKCIARWIALKYYKYIHKMENINNKSAYKHYRKLCSSYNKYLKTPQIYMCARNWNNIVFERVSLGTIEKFGHNFLNNNRIQEQHRIICKKNYINYMNKKNPFKTP